MNDDPYTSIDIHSKADLKIADFLVRELKNNKEFKK